MLSLELLYCFACRRACSIVRKAFATRSKMLVLGLLASALFIWRPAVSAQLTLTSLPNVLFQNNGGIHNIVQQSVIQLYCTANSTTGATPNVTWTKNGAELVNDPPHIRVRKFISVNEAYVTSTSSLVVDNFQPSDNGGYMCQASDGMVTMSGSTLSLIAFTSSAAESLTIVREPTAGEIGYEGVSGSPTDNRTAVRLGETIDPAGVLDSSRVLRCVGGHVGDATLENVRPPLVLWVRDGEQVVPNSRITITESATAGGLRNQSDLQISNFGPPDAGVYQCIFTDVDSGAEVITTTPLRLDAGNTLQLERVSSQVIILEPSEKLVLETRASGGYERIRWMRSGSPASFTTRTDPFFTSVPHEFTSFFEIFVREPTTMRDLGVYQVNLQSTTGQTEAEEVVFYVTPYSAPSTMPQRTTTVTILEGGSVNISCASTGNPIPSISWELGGSPAPFRQSNRVNAYQATVTGNQQLNFTQGNVSSVLHITSAAYPAHNGQYTCVGFSLHSGRSRTNNATITVDVQVPPEVQVTATLTRVVIGNSTTLTCTVTRSNPMGTYTYRWVHNNSITLSESGSMLTVNILTESNLGSYCCEVNNSAGLNGSNVATIELGDPPSTVTILPTHPVVVFGQTVDLVCIATGDPPITYAWVQLGEETIRLNLDPASGSFTLSITQVNQYGVYVCTATNDLGADVASVRIVQAISVTLLGSPMDVNVLSPGPAVLNCTATGEPTPHFTWTKLFPNGSTVELSESMTNIAISTSSSDENVTSTLTIEPTDASDAASYNCTAENIFHEVSAFEPAKVTVFVSPEVVTPVNGSTLRVNKTGNVSIMCSAHGIPAPSIRFLYRGTVLKRTGETGTALTSRISLSDESIVMSMNDGMFTVNRVLTLFSASEQDVGTFTCEAFSASLSLSNKNVFEVIVQTPATITSRPANTTVVSPHAAIFTCIATGVPLPRISWMRRQSLTPLYANDINTTITQRTVDQTTQRSSLTLLHPLPDDAAEYFCLAFNEAGADVASAVLTVHVVPDIIFPLDSSYTYTVNEFHPVIFTCSATGYPAPVLSWYRNGVLFNYDQTNTRVTLSDPVLYEGDIFVVSRNLTLRNTKDMDSGVYTCEASNGITVNPRVEQDFQLLVRVAPTILEPPENLTVVHPQSATFFCNATARPRPRITWWRMGNQLVDQPGVTEISSDTYGERGSLSTLNITMADPSDAGGYVCMATNLAGRDTSTVELTVHVVPNITFPPDSSFTYPVLEFNPVIFTCTATGYPPPVLSWYRNGVLFNYDQVTNVRVMLSDPTMPELYSTDGGNIFLVSRSLTLGNAMDADTGTYTCEAANGNSVQPNAEQEFQLFVQAAPRVTVLNEEQRAIAREGENATLSFRIDGHTPTLLQNLQWFYSSTFAERPDIDGEEITNYSNRTSLSMLTFSDFVNGQYINLTVSNIIGSGQRNSNETDVGRYFLTATNQFGTGFVYADLLVYGPPIVLASPEDQFLINNGSNATFQCRVLAAPEHDIVWTLTTGDGNALQRISTTDLHNTGRLSVNRNRNHLGFGALTVAGVRYSDRGVYNCTARNALGEKSAAASLAVHVLPVVHSTSSTTVVNVSAQATLYCLVTGYPLPDVTWNKDEDTLDTVRTIAYQVAVQDISMEDRQEIIGPFATRSLTIEMVELGVISVLQINSTERRDTGSYACTATNALPQTTQLLTTSQQISLTIVEPPDPPKSTHLAEYGSFWVTIEWETGFDGNLALEQFIIYLSTAESGFVVAVSANVDTLVSTNGRSTYNISDRLLPSTQYTFVVQMCNRLGCSNMDAAPSVTITTLESERTSTLFQLRLNPVRDCVTWVEEKRDQKFADIIAAVVQSVEADCSCSLPRASIQNYEFSCRSIDNTVVFRAELIYNIPHQDGFRAEDLVAFVSTWAQSGTSIVVDSMRLDVDSTCPTQLESLEAGDCELPATTVTEPVDGSVDMTIVGAAGGGGCLVLLIVIGGVITVIILVRRNRKKRTLSPKDDFERPQLPVDVAAPMKTNPAYGIKSISGRVAANNPTVAVYITPQSESDEEDHTYEPIPFDIPGQ